MLFRSDTRTVALERLDEVVEALRRALASKARVYWVCPLVEESEVLDVAAVEERHAHLSQIFGARVGMVHGRMKAAEKDKVMAAFADGSVDILVATTVIEVGVDVPQASVMVIEHAERFGLAQLHQLRGRVGRGGLPGLCLLVTFTESDSPARARLEAVAATVDGFELSRIDLQQRREGDVLGEAQSGKRSSLKVLNVLRDEDVIERARAAALELVAHDSRLTEYPALARRISQTLEQQRAEFLDKA